MNEQAAPNRGRKKGNFSRAAAFHGYWGKDWVEKGRGNKEPKWETRGRANIKARTRTVESVRLFTLMLSHA